MPGLSESAVARLVNNTQRYYPSNYSILRIMYPEKHKSLVEAVKVMSSLEIFVIEKNVKLNSEYLQEQSLKL